MIVQLDQRAEHLLAARRHAPAACVRDLGQQAAEMQTLQQPRHFAGLSAALIGAGMLAPQGLADLSVVESAQQVVAREHGPEQLGVVGTSRIETRVGAFFPCLNFVTLDFVKCDICWYAGAGSSTTERASRYRSSAARATR